MSDCVNKMSSIDIDIDKNIKHVDSHSVLNGNQTAVSVVYQQIAT